MKRFVWIKTQFEGFHRWKDAPPEVAFLRVFHRHIFHVKLTMEVKHDNREIEFITLKRKVDDYIDEMFTETNMELSCEQIAYQLMAEFDAFCVEVSEDGENGAMVIQTKEK